MGPLNLSKLQEEEGKLAKIIVILKDVLEFDREYPGILSPSLVQDVRENKFYLQEM